MAQDFGDDIGSALLSFVERSATYTFRPYRNGNFPARDWHEKAALKQGETKEAAAQIAEEKAAREAVILPMGTVEDASYYAQMLREHNLYAAAYVGAGGKGFLSFAREDAGEVAALSGEYVRLMETIRAQRIADTLRNGKPLTQETFSRLTEVSSYPNLPAPDVTVIPATIRYKDAPDATYDVLFSEQDTEGLDMDDSIFFSGYSHKELTEMALRGESPEDFDVLSVGEPYQVHATYQKTDTPSASRLDMDAHLSPEDISSHTERILSAARTAKEGCIDFSDFERRMNEQGFGLTETAKGEVMPYEPASLLKDGSVPPFERGRDWPVSAETLKNRYGCDITHAWFEKNTPKQPGIVPETPMQQIEEPVASDGAFDTDGRTPDATLGIHSHDGKDTDTRSATMDAEQNGTVVYPSEVKKQQHAAEDAKETYDLASMSKEMTAAKNQLASERGSVSIEHDLSNHMQPSL